MASQLPCRWGGQRAGCMPSPKSRLTPQAGRCKVSKYKPKGLAAPRGHHSLVPLAYKARRLESLQSEQVRACPVD